MCLGLSKRATRASEGWLSCAGRYIVHCAQGVSGVCVQEASVWNVCAGELEDVR